jgi:type 1 glutamine amidotransferase
MPSVGREQGARGADTGDYPISWTREHGGGRVFVTSLGHFPDVWGTPDFVQHLLQGMRVAAGRAAVGASGD